MAKRRKSKRKSRKLWTLPKLPQWNVSWPSARRASSTAVWVVAAGGLVAAWVAGVPRLEAYAVDHQRAGPIEVRLGELPEWVGPELETMLAETVARSIGPDQFQQADLVNAREALLATGWFARVDQLRRVGDRTVEVTATLAEPFAVIRDVAGRQDHLVDTQGRLMPRVFAAGEQTAYIAITGTTYDRPQRTGMMWAGTDITAALELLALIADQPGRTQVAGIDVARHRKDGSIRLISDRGCTIIWGRAPGEEAVGDVPARQKLGYLDYHYQHTGHIDRGLVELDITGDVVVGR